MPSQILAYHANIMVSQNNKVYEMIVSVPDWGSDSVIMHDLADKFKVDTVGEVVGELTKRGVVLKEKPITTQLKDDKELWDWNRTLRS